MGFSDSFKKLRDQISPEEVNKLKERGSKEAGRFVAKHAFEDVSHKKSSRGRLSGSQQMNQLTAGFFSKGVVSSLFSATEDPSTTGGFTTSLERAQRGSIKGANLGHQALFSEKQDKTTPPPVASLPSQGAGVTAAKQEARRRALERARGRAGFASTIGTTPLGLTGDGAAIGKKRLTGE